MARPATQTNKETPLRVHTRSFHAKHMRMCMQASALWLLVATKVHSCALCCYTAEHTSLQQVIDPQSSVKAEHTRAPSSFP